MKYRVLKELPQGQQPGAILDVPEAIGDVLLLVGAVQKIEPDKPPRGRYHRADLQAETPGEA